MVWLSDDELAAVKAAAERDGMATGAWLGEVGVRAARTAAQPEPGWDGAMRESMVLRGELAEARRVLRNVGGNLNDVARHANATGELHAATANVMAIVARVVATVDEAVGHVADLTAAARSELLAERRPR